MRCQVSTLHASLSADILRAENLPERGGVLFFFFFAECFCFAGVPFCFADLVWILPPPPTPPISSATPRNWTTVPQQEPPWRRAPTTNTKSTNYHAANGNVPRLNAGRHPSTQYRLGTDESVLLTTANCTNYVGNGSGYVLCPPTKTVPLLFKTTRSITAWRWSGEFFVLVCAAPCCFSLAFAVYQNVAHVAAPAVPTQRHTTTRCTAAKCNIAGWTVLAKVDRCGNRNWTPFVVPTSWKKKK